MTLFGHPITQIIRWCGANGFTLAETRTAVTALRIKAKSKKRPAANTIAWQHRWGRLNPSEVVTLEPNQANALLIFKTDGGAA